MKTYLLTALFCFTVILTPQLAFADDKAELTGLLNEFLAGATRNDASIHQAYWSEQLVYTSSSGKRFGKKELMQGVTSRGLLTPAEIDTVYSSEDVQIALFGDTAVVTFVLVGTSASETKRFLNSGTFVRQQGRWQVVNWQATAKANEP